MQALEIHAGARALRHLREHGLRPADVHAIPAAAGGPKGLVLNPLARLHRSVAQLSGGDYRIELRSRRDDELGDLTRAFNRMAGEIRSHTEKLEQRIEERTRDQSYRLDPSKASESATLTGDPETDALLALYVRPTPLGAA